MRDKNGNRLLAVWRGFNAGYPYMVAAPTRKIAAEITKLVPECLRRVKGVYATGKPREL